MGVFWQVVCSMAISMTSLNTGLVFTWPSSTVVLFSTENTTLSRPMSSSEIALFGSLTSIGALVGTPILGCILDAIGRKYCCLLLALCQVIAWTTILTFRQVEVVLAGVFFSGLGCGIFLLGPLYLAEFCQENIRGAATSGSVVFYTVGMLISYVIGQFLSYDYMLYTCLSLAVLGVASIFIVKESPVYLMKKGLETDAAKSIAFYRSCEIDSKTVIDELNIIRRSLNPEMDGDDTPEMENLKPSDKIKIKEKMGLFEFIKKSKSTRQAFLIGIILMALSICQGLAAVQVYADPLFKAAVPTISSNLCCIILAGITLVSAVVTAFLTDRVGRKPLMIWASLTCGVCCMILGSQIQLQWGPPMFTVVALNAFCFAYCLGPGTVPFVFVAEVFLPEVRSKVISVLIEVAWIFTFVVLYTYNPIIELFGMGPLFYLYAAIAFLTALFCFFCMPETKGMTMDAVQVLFVNKKKERSKNLYV